MILAAGKGTRLKSDRQKVLHDVCGRPALWHVVRAALAARPRKLVVVVHHGREAVEETVRAWGLKAEVAFVDREGLELLCSLGRRGVRLDCSGFVAEQLKARGCR